MSDLKPRGVMVMIDGVERYILFTLNVIDEIQSDTGKTMQEVLGRLKDEVQLPTTLRYLLTVLLNDEADRIHDKNPNSDLKKMTERQVGSVVTVDDIPLLNSAVLIAYGLSLPEPEDDYPNQTSEQ